jgi:hypothetical protein
MKKIFVSAGLAAIGAAGLQSALADDTSPKYWNVSATLRGFYDDNYDITGTKKGSFGIEFLPGVSIHVPLQQTDFGLRYTYGLYYYEDRDQLGVNPFDQTHQLDLWLDHAFNERWKANVNDTFAVGQEPELLNSNPLMGTPTPYRINGDNISNHGSVGLNTDWTRQFSTALTYDNNFYDYKNSGTMLVGGPPPMLVGPGGLGGASLAGLLDRVEESIALDLKWHLQPETTVFVGYQFSWVNYTGNEPVAIIPWAPSPSGVFVYHSSDRDETSQTGYLGLEHQFTPNLSATVRAGASYTDSYADPLFPNTAWTPYADLSVSYTYIPGSYVQFGFTHEIAATDQVQPNFAGKITQYAEDSVIYVDVNHRFTPKLVGTVIGRVQYSTFEGGAASSTDETDYSLGINLSYQINQYLSVDGGYNFDDLVTGLAGYSYSRNRVYAGLTLNY